MNKYEIKAIELVNNLHEIICDVDSLSSKVLSYQKAIQCALIAVDELIANEHLEAGDASFWEPVKDELLKMK